ncbi:MAG: ABC transporter ATP-binding protein [Thermodesulfobacteriota bacterium]
MAFFDVHDVSKSFGGLMVIQRLSFSLQEGEILGVIGPNGSGKTTLFNLVTGFLRTDRGRIAFQGNEIANLRPSSVCKLGITRTFQLVKPFAGLTVLQNVIAGRAYGREPAKDLKRAREESVELLDLTGLSRKQDAPASQLSVIDRKRLEIARALATRPKLLLLDEVFAGLNPAETEESLLLIQKIKGLGTTLMIVEHVIRVILGVSDRVIVLSSGYKIFDGDPGEAVNDRKVIEAYLGEDFHA